MNIKTIASAVLAAVVLCAAPAFADGKVSLVAYNDVVEVNDGSVWPADTRFLARPET